jgi:hypothetical protein
MSKASFPKGITGTSNFDAFFTDFLAIAKTK